MTKITVEGFRPVANRWPVYALDTTTGATNIEYFANQAEAERAGPHVGVGDIRRIGSWWWNPKGLVAVYVSDERLFLWVDGRRIDLMRSDVTVERRSDFLLRKHFDVRVSGAVASSVHYSHLDNESVPDDDIFLYIAEMLCTLEGRCRALLLRQDKMRGRREITEDYLGQLVPRVHECVALWKKRWENDANQGPT